MRKKRKRRSRDHIWIVDAAGNSTSHTTRRKAQSHVAYRRAVWVGEDAICLLSQAERQAAQHRWERQNEELLVEVEIMRRRAGGMIPWRGSRKSDGNKRWVIYPPGPVRS